MGRVPQRDGHAQEGADAEQQPTQHEGRQAACQPHPPTPASACANTRSPASGREDLSRGPETMDHGSLLHTRSLGMREPSQRRSGEEGHDAVSARSERLSLCVDWVLTSDPDGAHGAVHAAWLH